MKYFIILISIFLFQGCLYFNDRGVSAHLYDNCHSYYDGDGNFIESCDENIIDYDEAQDGIVELKDTIVHSINKITDSEDSTSGGISIEELSTQEQNTLLDNTNEPIREQIESSQCPCK